MQLFPPRPFKLNLTLLKKQQRRTWPLLLLSLIMSCGLALFASALCKELLEEQTLWAQGVTGKLTRIQGTTTEYKNTFVWDNTYEFKLWYLDAQGAQKTADVKFTYLLSELNDSAPVELRYDPHAPNRVVLNWQAKGGLPRWGMFIVVGLMAMCLFAIIPSVLWKSRKLRRLLEQVAQDSEEVWVEVVQQGFVYGTHYVQYVPHRETDGGGKKVIKASMSSPPLIIPRDGKAFAVVFRSPQQPSQQYFVPNDLGPFVFATEEKSQMAQTLAGWRGN